MYKQYNTKKIGRWSLDERLKMLMILNLKDKNLLKKSSRRKINGVKKWLFIKKRWFKNRETVQLRSHYQKAIKITSLNKYIYKFTNLQKLRVLLEIIINE